MINWSARESINTFCKKGSISPELEYEIRLKHIARFFEDLFISEEDSNCAIIINHLHSHVQYIKLIGQYVSEQVEHYNSEKTNKLFFSQLSGDANLYFALAPFIYTNRRISIKTREKIQVPAEVKFYISSSLFKGRLQIEKLEYENLSEYPLESPEYRLIKLGFQKCESDSNSNQTESKSVSYKKRSESDSEEKEVTELEISHLSSYSNSSSSLLENRSLQSSILKQSTDDDETTFC